MNTPNEAQRLIESHIETLDEHKGQLERALEHLKGSGAGEGGGGGQNRRGGRASAGKGRVRAGRGQGRRSQGSSAGGGQAPRGARRAEVIADLQANPESKAAEIAGRVGVNPKHAQTILANLVKQGIATKQGQRYSAAANA